MTDQGWRVSALKAYTADMSLHDERDRQTGERGGKSIDLCLM